MKLIRRTLDLQLVPLVVLVLTILVSTSLTAWPEEEGGTEVEGFTLYRYGESGNEELIWELSGGRGTEDDGDLLVDKFTLTIKTSGEEETTVYEISGEKIRIGENPNGRTGSTLGEVDIRIGGEIEGEAEDVKYDFQTGEIEGKKLQMTVTRDGADLELGGSEFSYTYEPERLTVQGGFSVSIFWTGEGPTRISGEELTWAPGQELETSGDLTATLDSGWDLTAEKMTWKPKEGLFTASGGAKAVKGESTLTGKSLEYDIEKEEITVQAAKLTVDD